MINITSKQSCAISYSSQENSVRIDLTNYVHQSLMATIEAINIAIASSDSSTNPYGLFHHPQSGVETKLVFASDAMRYQDAIIEIVKEMYISCNSPTHICGKRGQIYFY